MDSVHTGPILEVNAALRKHLLYSFNELVHKRIEFIRRWASPADAEVQRIAEILFVVGSGVEIHGQQIPRRHSGAGGVQLQLADWNRRPVCSKISQAQNAAAVGNADESDVLLGPVLQNFFHLTAPRDR